jgi:hypothetical protein
MNYDEYLSLRRDNPSRGSTTQPPNKTASTDNLTATETATTNNTKNPPLHPPPPPKMARGLIVNKTWPEYIAMRVLIVLMRDLPWLCLLYWFVVFALGGVVAIAHPVSLVIEVLGAIEILFYLLFFLPYRAWLQGHPPYKPPPLTRAQRAGLIYKGLDLVPDMEMFIRKWSNMANSEDIRRENIKEFLLWALFEVDMSKGGVVDASVNAELEQYVSEAETKLGRKFLPGKGSAETIRLPFDPVLIEHRALLFYMVC